jgi:drug/metabolite transporter (DMT)-like permease
MVYKRVMTRLAPLIFVLGFGLSVATPFFNYAFVKYSPYPFFNSLCLTLFSIPLAMLLNWTTRGSQLLFSWTVPSSKTCVLMLISSVFYVCAICVTQFCYLYSDLDFVVTFSFLSVVLDGVFPLIFFSEPLAIPGVLSSLVIIFGLFTLSFNFGWSTQRASPFIQILLELLLSFSLTMSAVSFRKLTGVVATFETLSVSFLNMWIHICAAIPLLLAFLLSEFPTIPHLTDLVTWDLATLVVFAAISAELSSVCRAFLKDCPGYGFVDDFSPFKCLPILLISFKLYSHTKYTPNQIFGLIFILAGYLGLSLAGEKKGKPAAADEDADFASLLGDDADRVEGQASIASL